MHARSIIRQSGEHRFDTVSNVQIGLSLPSIPKHVQAIRIALAEQRNESKNEGPNSESLSVRLNETLGGNLRGPIERRLDRKRRGLRRWENGRIAVYRSGR